jgi:hypothetical protein
MLGSGSTAIVTASRPAPLPLTQQPPAPDTLRRGFLKVQARVDSFYLVFDQDFRNATVWQSGDSLAVTAGIHQLLIVNERMFDYGQTVNVLPDTVTVLSVEGQVRSNPLKTWQNAIERLRKQRNLEVVTDYDTDVYLGERWLGRGFATLDTAGGRYRLAFRNQAAGNHSRSVSLRSDRLMRVSSYSRPAAIVVRVLSPIPGAAQVYQREVWKALAFGAAGAVAGSLALRFRARFVSLNDSYQTALAQYSAEGTEEGAYTWGLEAERLRESASSAALRRDIAASSFFAVVLTSVVDAWRRPRGGFRHNGPAESEAPLRAFVRPEGPGIALGISFRWW